METLLTLVFYVWLFVRIYRIVYPSLYGDD